MGAIQPDQSVTYDHEGGYNGVKSGPLTAYPGEHSLERGVCVSHMRARTGGIPTAVTLVKAGMISGVLDETSKQQVNSRGVFRDARCQRPAAPAYRRHTTLDSNTSATQWSLMRDVHAVCKAVGIHGADVDLGLRPASHRRWAGPCFFDKETGRRATTHRATSDRAGNALKTISNTHKLILRSHTGIRAS